MFDFIYNAFGAILSFFDGITGSYLVAILLLALLIKVALFPLGIKQQKNMVKQAKLRPKEMAIRQKYAGREDNATKQKMQQEVMELYQQEKFNPMGGCLPLLVQLPIIWILYRVIICPLQYICGFTAEAVTELMNRVASLLEAGTLNTAGIENIVSSNSMSEINLIRIIQNNVNHFTDINVESLPNFNIFGAFNLGDTPTVALNWLILIPILTFVFAFASNKLIKKLSYQSIDVAQQGASMKIMDFMMPLLSLWISFSVPAVLGIYWIFQNIFSVVQQLILVKMYPYPKFTEEDYKAAVKEMNGKLPKQKKNAGNSSGVRVRSLHHIDDEDYESLPEKSTAKESNKKAEENKLLEKAVLKEEPKREGEPSEKTEEKSKEESKEEFKEKSSEEKEISKE